MTLDANTGARPILVCFAVKEEANPFLRHARMRDGISVVLTGMGRRNAEREFRRAISSLEPACVISAGFAGALNAELEFGRVVFDADKSFPFTGRLCEARATSVRFHCAEQIAVTAAEKRMLRQSMAADVVEMESEAIRAICAERQIPSATVRIISDGADEDLPLNFNQLLNAKEELDLQKLALAVLRNPQRIPALIRFGRRTRYAAESLARVLLHVIP